MLVNVNRCLLSQNLPSHTYQWFQYEGKTFNWMSRRFWIDELRNWGCHFHLFQNKLWHPQVPRNIDSFFFLEIIISVSERKFIKSSNLSKERIFKIIHHSLNQRTLDWNLNLCPFQLKLSCRFWDWNTLLKLCQLIILSTDKNHVFISSFQDEIFLGFIKSTDPVLYKWLQSSLICSGIIQSPLSRFD